jgi:hypothetical protein
MKDSGTLVMVRIVLLLWPLVLLAGCGEPEGARDVPITKSTRAATDADARAATKAPRAIATH